MFKPDVNFLAVYKQDSAAGVYDPRIEAMNLRSDQVSALENNVVCLNFIEFFRQRMRSADWKPFRSFLLVIGHECMPTAGAEIEVPASVELAWLQKWTQPTEVSWYQAKNGLQHSPYLSFFVLKQKVYTLDDLEIKDALHLMGKLPQDQILMHFEADDVSRPYRPHFRVLQNFCKFREILKRAMGNNLSSDCWDAVHDEIWNRISEREEPYLSEIFLPSGISSTSKVPNFASALHGDFLGSFKADQWASFDIKVESDTKPIIDDASTVVSYFKHFFERLISWTLTITRRAFCVDDAPIFVDLLVSAAKSSLTRAVFWLVLPDRAGSTDACDPATFLNVFLRLLENMIQLSSRAEQFLSFLVMCEHPLRYFLLDNNLDNFFAKAKEISWKEEANWMKLYDNNTWGFNWTEIELMMKDTPYFAYHVFIRRYKDDRNCYYRLIQLMSTNPIIFSETNFEANAEVGVNVRFGSKYAMKSSLHFNNFKTARRVVEIWKAIQTEQLGSRQRTKFRVSAQDKLLLLTVEQNKNNGFSKMMHKLKLLCADPKIITFNCIPPLLLRNKLSNTVDPTNSDLRKMFDELTIHDRYELGLNRENFAAYLNHLFSFCEKFDPQLSVGSCFGEMLSACLGSMVVRALFSLIFPISRVGEANIAPAAATAVRRLSAVIDSMLSIKNNSLVLYTLRLLKHPGINNNNEENVISWNVEANWLLHLDKDRLEFDHVDFTLLSNPAYILFRQVCRNFHNLDDTLILSVIYDIEFLKQRGTDLESFEAQLNYLPCTKAVNASAITATAAPHFSYLRKYSLFHMMWNKLLVQLLNPTLETGFSDCVLLKLWNLMSGSGGNLMLINVFIPSSQSLHWTGSLTYLPALQKFGILSIAKSCPEQLKKICMGFERWNEHLDEDIIPAHEVLVSRMLIWTNKLLELGNATASNKADLFVEIMMACFCDVAMRALVMTFDPEPSTLNDFIRTNEGIESYSIASIKFIHRLSLTLKDELWMEYRCFLSVLKHPTVDGGKRTEQLPLWENESKWINERIDKYKPGALNWKEFQYLMTQTPFILLLITTKGLPEAEQASALHGVPIKYLVSQFNADYVSSINRSGAAPHFIAMCLNDSAKNLPLTAFKERHIISDGFFRTILNEACIDEQNPQLLRLYNLLHATVLKIDPESQKTSWQVEMLKLAPNLSSVLISFLYTFGKNEKLQRDEMILGCLILLVLQLESCKCEALACETDEQHKIFNACTFASEWMHSDKAFVNKVSLFIFCFIVICILEIVFRYVDGFEICSLVCFYLFQLYVRIRRCW